MKIKDFNKFGGTELRTEIQTTVYYELLLWILDKSKNGDKLEFFTEEKWEEDFRKWCSDENIYQYKGKFKRFNMILSTLMKKMEIIKSSVDPTDNSKKAYVFKNEEVKSLFEKCDSKNFFFIFMQYGFKKEGRPFFEMIKFLKNNPEKNNAKKLALSFMVYDGNERFEDLYNMDIPKEIAKNDYDVFLESDDITDVLDFRKPPKFYNFYHKIFLLKQKNEIIVMKDINDSGYIHNKDKYFKSIFFEHNERFSYQKFVDRLNEEDFLDLVKKFLESKYSCLLLKEYLDLFNRWVFDLGISKTSSTKCEHYDSDSIENLSNGKYYLLNNSDKKIEYPYSIDQVNEFLFNISENDFKFKYDDKYKRELSFIANSVLAEYFVNIKYCYLYNIEPINFIKYVNTKVTIDLFPIFTAPGGQPDMCFYNEYIIHNIETTILKTKRENENNEIFPCLKHLKDSINKHQGEFAKELYLTFITSLESEEFNARFEHNFNYDFNFDDNRIKKLIVNNFNESFFIKGLK